MSGDVVLDRLRQVARDEFGIDPASVLLTDCDEVTVPKRDVIEWANAAMRAYGTRGAPPISTTLHDAADRISGGGGASTNAGGCWQWDEP